MASFRAFVRRWERDREFWDTIPNSSVLMLLVVAFCLFAAIGTISQLDSSSAFLRRFWVAPLMTGGFAVGYTWAAVRRKWVALIALFPVQIIAASLLSWYMERHPGSSFTLSDEAHLWLEANSIAAMIFVTVGFALLMSFIRREGKRFARTHAEMQLAGEIHKSLVPTIERRIGDYEFYAISLASGMVGGDLVNVIAREDGWLAYVADVSGHGVSSGVLMAMIKSSAHTAMRLRHGSDGLLEGINAVLCSLKAPNMFATCAFVAYTPDVFLGTRDSGLDPTQSRFEAGLRYSLAGHLPLIRRRDKEVELHAAENLPLGVFPDTIFQSLPLDMQKDDVLVLLTDGLTEVFDKAGTELGFDAISVVVRDTGARPLPEIAAAIFERASRHGPPSDDQSLLLIRRIG